MLLGDLNLDILKWGRETGLKAKLISEVNSNVVTEGFAQLIDSPTWFQYNKRPACLDQIWSNNVARIAQIQNKSWVRSDHNLIMVEIRKQGNKSIWKRDKARDIAVLSKESPDWTIYSKLRNKCVNALRLDKEKSKKAVPMPGN